MISLKHPKTLESVGVPGMPFLTHTKQIPPWRRTPQPESPAWEKGSKAVEAGEGIYTIHFPIAQYACEEGIEYEQLRT